MVMKKKFTIIIPTVINPFMPSVACIQRSAKIYILI